MKTAFLLVLTILVCHSVGAQNPTLKTALINQLSSKPQFAGGQPALYAFLAKNIQYPQMERDNYIQGKVVLRFMVDTAGAIKDIKVLRAVSPGLDNEAIRVVKQMPKWKPATYHGKPVPVYYILPVVFRLK